MWTKERRKQYSEMWHKKWQEEDYRKKVIKGQTQVGLRAYDIKYSKDEEVLSMQKRNQRKQDFVRKVLDEAKRKKLIHAGHLGQNINTIV
jgi:hypothetical protein